MEKNNIEKKVDHNFDGIRKMVHIWYSDSDEDYKIDLFLNSKKQYFSRFSHYQKEGMSLQLSKYEALQDVYSDLHEFS